MTSLQAEGVSRMMVGGGMPETSTKRLAKPLCSAAVTKLLVGSWGSLGVPLDGVPFTSHGVSWFSLGIFLQLPAPEASRKAGLTH